jgi:glycosyltransferase involved in cell wall biosynthesis
MKIHKPRLSVIVPNYNHSRFLVKLLQNIMSQSFCPMEILVIDDGSTDNSVEVVMEFAKQNQLVQLFLNGENRGVIYSANRGAELASGDYIYFAAADDLFLPGIFEESMSLLSRYPDAGLCSAIVEVQRQDGTSYPACIERISSNECFLSPTDCLKLLRLHDSWMGGNSTIFQRAAYLKAGGLTPELGALSDVFLEMVIALTHGVCFVPNTLAVQSLADSSYSAVARADWTASMNMYSEAANLMRTTYRELFPTDYVNAWQQRELHVVRLTTLKRIHMEKMGVIRSFFKDKSLIDRLFIFCINSVIQFQLFAIVTFLFLSLGKEFRRVIVRRVRVGFLRIRHMQKRNHMERIVSAKKNGST